MNTQIHGNVTTMGTFEKLLSMANEGFTFNQKLFRFVKDKQFSHFPYRKVGLGCNMSCVVYDAYGEELAIYLVNHTLKEAYEIMDAEHRITFTKNGDFDLSLGKDIRTFSPVIVNPFVRSVALFEWNTQEDGRAWSDEMDFGIKNGDSKFIYGVINEKLEVIAPFRYIDDTRKVEHYRAHPYELIDTNMQVSNETTNIP